MKKLLPFVGLCGAVFFGFGFITLILLRSELGALGGDLWSNGIVGLHFVVGFILLAWFLLTGGIRKVESSTIKRVTGFGLTASVYSLLFVGLIALINYISVRHEFLHYDSTIEQVYTLSPQAVQVFSELKSPITLRGFYLDGRVDPREEDLIKQIVRAFPEKVNWKVIDPEKAPQLAEKYGISESGTIHFAFSSEASTRVSKISRDISEETIVNAVLKLTRGEVKVVYYLVGHGEADLDGRGESGYQFLLEAITGENLQVKPLQLKGETDLPADAAALIVSAPERNWLEAEVNAIANYLSRGGSAIFLHEPRTTDDIKKIVQPYGISIGDDVVIDQEVRYFTGPSLGVQPLVKEYNFHPITKGFSEGVLFTIVSSVRKSLELPAEVIAIELAKTSLQSWAERNLALVFSDDPQAALEADDQKGPIPVAVAWERKVGGSTDNKTQRMVVIGDRDFVANASIRLLFNRDFFLNALNWVVGDDQQVTIRARSLRQSVTAITQAEMRTMFLFTGILLPEIVLIAGLAVWWARRN